MDALLEGWRACWTHCPVAAPQLVSQLIHAAILHVKAAAEGSWGMLLCCPDNGGRLISKALCCLLLRQLHEDRLSKPFGGIIIHILQWRQQLLLKALHLLLALLLQLLLPHLLVGQQRLWLLRRLLLLLLLLLPLSPLLRRLQRLLHPLHWLPGGKDDQPSLPDQSQRPVAVAWHLLFKPAQALSCTLCQGLLHVYTLHHIREMLSANHMLHCINQLSQSRRQ